MARTGFFLAHAAVVGLLLMTGMQSGLSWVVLLVVCGTFCIGIWDMLQVRHSLRRNFPLIGRGRWVMEHLRPFVRQYLIESDTDATPISRMFRSIVYQRAKGDLDSIPFGTRLDVNVEGYEWIGHSIAALNVEDMPGDPRVLIGGSRCRQPYSASLLNISAMSYGSLSSNALLALNKGAAEGGFYHNTGEGGLSEYHLAHGADVVWQIGTGYFGCRHSDGRFNPEKFARGASEPQVRMIEIKLSQGAKPGHGGILPASKNTEIIARVRGVTPHTEVVSPSAHTAFRSPVGLLEFVDQLRELSGGKPVGFKLCVGRESEFIAICKAMIETGIRPDFITVDGGEGGTGAAPLEYSNHIGMPLRDGLSFVTDCLIGFDLREEIRVIAAGKILSAFHLARTLALGADLCNSARGMMLALGCVQSLACNTNRCPTGITTQDPALVRGLDVEDKSARVARYHEETVDALRDITSSAGLRHPSELNRSHVHRRIDPHHISRLDEMYPYPEAGSFLTPPYPEAYRRYLEEASINTFLPGEQVLAEPA
jgi:glutamate synthase domain-containing protein 2